MKWCEREFADFVYVIAIFYGGLTQLIAGIWEMYVGNTFAATAFSSYAAFWMSFGLFGILVKNGTLVSSSEFNHAESIYFIQWGVFTFFLFICTLQKNRALQFTFGNLVIAFILLGIGIENEPVKKIGGYFGFIAGCGAMYTAFAELINSSFESTLLPGLEKHEIVRTSRVIL